MLLMCRAHAAGVAAGARRAVLAAAMPGTPSPLQNPTPTSPIAGTGVQTMLGYCMWGTLIACGVVALVSGGILAFGQLSNNPGHSDKGKRALAYSLVGVAIAAIAIPTVKNVFDTVQAT